MTLAASLYLLAFGPFVLFPAVLVAGVVVGIPACMAVSWLLDKLPEEWR